MGKRADTGEDRGYRGKERLARRDRAHRPDQAKPDRDPFKRFPMTRRDADSGVHQFVREDGRDLRGHRVGRVRKIGPNEYLELPVAAASVIPAFADRLAFGPATGKADRDTHARGQGSVKVREQRGHADCHPVQPALAIVLLYRLISSKSPRGDGLLPSALPRGEQRGRGGQRESAGVVRARRSEPWPS